MFGTKRRELERRELELKLERENFEREKENFAKQLEMKYQFDKKALEDEWHCKLGNYIEKEVKAERDKIYALLEKTVDTVVKLNTNKEQTTNNIIK